jgi:hypothetical protein
MLHREFAATPDATEEAQEGGLQGEVVLTGIGGVFAVVGDGLEASYSWRTMHER